MNESIVQVALREEITSLKAQLVVAKKVSADRLRRIAELNRTEETLRKVMDELSKDVEAL